MIAEILAELKAMRAELRELIQTRSHDVTASQTRCSNGDLEALGKLLPALGGLFGSTPFTVREALRDPGIRSVAPPSPDALGRLLSRAASDGISVGNLLVTRVSREHGAALWGLLGSFSLP